MPQPPKNMNERDAITQKYRPILAGISTSGASEEEGFQNEVLRPILKWLHPLLTAVVEHRLRARKKPLDTSSPTAYARALESWLKDDTKVRLELSSMIIGHFTTTEMVYYLDHRSLINRRITSMLIKRLVSHFVALPS